MTGRAWLAARDASKIDTEHHASLGAGVAPFDGIISGIRRASPINDDDRRRIETAEVMARTNSGRMSAEHPLRRRNL